MTYRFPINVGDRVAIAPHHDLWMAGCRFGSVDTVNAYHDREGRYYNITLDTGRLVSLDQSDLLGAVGHPEQPSPHREDSSISIEHIGVCDLDHGGPNNSARVYGHAVRTCIRITATDQWIYDKATP